ncbi:hypothetical protein GQ37_022630 [Janthinobacterium sp. BJB1]|nr:hypothetical protein GQ37_022630 [Janthinobacterium sp. BJB1]
MVISAPQPRELALAFKKSVAADLYTAQDLIDIAGIAAANSYADEISALRNVVKDGLLTQNDLGSTLLDHPRLYQLICSMLSISASVELADGTRLPSPINPPRDASTCKSIAGVLLDLGVGVLLNNPSALDSLFMIAQISIDAPKRRFRVDARIKNRIQQAVERAVIYSAKNSGCLFQLGNKSLLPLNERRIAEYVITVDGVPKFAVAATFQTHTGGRQTREMRALYPSLKASLAGQGITLILIADGQGMRDMSDKVLTELCTLVPNTMSIAQAEGEGLIRAFEKVPSIPEPAVVDIFVIKKLIDNALTTGTTAKADSLPIGNVAARLALANYATSNVKLNLKLADDGVSLEWQNSSLVKQFRELQWQYIGIEALKGFAALLSVDLKNETVIDENKTVATIRILDDQVLASRFAIFSSPVKVDASILREVARYALQYAPESKVAVLITDKPVSDTGLQVLRDAQAFLPVTVAVIDIKTCIEMAQSTDLPRERLKALLLKQTDLTKLSPFVVRGVTPTRVFFGREQEEATLLSTLSTNSVALLGGRRIGKTSLIRHSFARLTSANLRPYFGDCQVVRTWEDFGFMAARNWKVKLPEAFKPQHLFDLVDQLSKGSDRPVVILLDEIDQLLDWDTSHSEDEVPEAFFRACRSISQQGLAQFVFSGERTIANRLWDATSPHWNFCRPLMLQQLGFDAAKSLIAKPLETLGIRLDQREIFLQLCWESTDGHPELLQFLGDKIVASVNNRDRTDVYTSPQDIKNITQQFEFSEQYLETYWGQATPIERIVSILLLEHASSVEELVEGFKNLGTVANGAQIQAALRMLELYGIAQQSHTGYEIRARWFPTALSYYGGPERAINRYLGEIKA